MVEHWEIEKAFIDKHNSMADNSDQGYMLVLNGKDLYQNVMVSHNFTLLQSVGRALCLTASVYEIGTIVKIAQREKELWRCDQKLPQKEVYDLSKVKADLAASVASGRNRPVPEHIPQTIIDYIKKESNFGR